VHGDSATLARVFGALIPLQPVEWTDAGLLCAPQSAPDFAPAAIASCPLPVSAVPAVRVWPDSPCGLVAGWYRRSDRHAGAPAGMRELVQSAGAGFGPGDHPTTVMCLAALDHLPSGDAVDVGCGSGLLAQAWARLGRGRVLAIDLDPAAVAQTRASVDLAGVGALVETRRQAVETCPRDELAGTTLFVNMPAASHGALLRRLRVAPTAAVVSGLRPGEAGPVVDHYRRLGMRRVRSARAGRFDCHVLVDAR
jgi:SAM-dependent methyltransferase